MDNLTNFLLNIFSVSENKKKSNSVFQERKNVKYKYTKATSALVLTFDQTIDISFLELIPQHKKYIFSKVQIKAEFLMRYDDNC